MRLDARFALRTLDMYRGFMRPTGSAEELEKRRRRAVGLLLKGRSAAEVATDVGASVRNVRRWLRAYRQHGDAGLAARANNGRPRRLTQQQHDELAEMLIDGPEVHGFGSKRWNDVQIAVLIARRFDVVFDPRHVARITNRLPFSDDDLLIRRPRTRWQELVDLPDELQKSNAG